ncbi:MAG: hypothetical protein LR015_04055 [Verrucomicrobia bacterium]|nr:hypothetical protein [Verrucomicrobiota bacterium]
MRQRQISEMRSTLRGNPRDNETRLALARLLRDINNYPEAARQYGFYLQLRPDDHLVRREYAQLLSWLPEARDQALAETQTLIEQFPDDDSLRIQLMQLRRWSNLINQEDRLEMLNMRRRLEDALLFDPEDQDAMFNLASLNELQERWETAIAIYRSILIATRRMSRPGIPSVPFTLCRTIGLPLCARKFPPIHVRWARGWCWPDIYCNRGACPTRWKLLRTFWLWILGTVRHGKLSAVQPYKFSVREGIVCAICAT